MTASPPPGWYPDPERLGAWRWWDGRAWSSYQHDARAAQWRGERRLEHKSAPFAEAALLVYEFSAAIAVLVLWTREAADRRFWHSFHLLFASGTSVPTIGTFPSAGYELVLSLVSGAAEVAFLIWQFRAARVAAAIGYPARLSPGWGIGVWFIPIVNLWMPSRAMRDLFPPGHHLRRSAGWLWVAFVFSLLADSGALVICEWNSSADPFAYLAVVATNLLVGGYGLSLIRAVEALHHDATAYLKDATV